MQNLTAQFIESFYMTDQEKILKTNFVEEVAMIEQLCSMTLTQDDEHYLNSFVSKEIPKLQTMLTKTYSNEILSTSHISKDKTVEDSLIEQVKLIKSNFKIFFTQVFDDEKFKILANANLLNQKSNNFKSNNGTAIAPSLKTQVQDETFFKPIVMPTAKKIEDIGNKILDENIGNWENNFKRKSQTYIENTENNNFKPVNKDINNPLDSITKNIKKIQNKKEISPGIFIGMITFILAILYFVS